MSENIIIRSRKQPYVVFGLLFGPIIIGSAYVALHTGETSLLEGSAAMGFLLVLLWWYLSTFKLILIRNKFASITKQKEMRIGQFHPPRVGEAGGGLERDAIIYKELWRTMDFPIDIVRSIEPGKLFGLSGTWIVHRRDDGNSMLIKVANFSPSELRRFAQAVVDRNPTIEITALPIGSRGRSSDRQIS